MLSLSHSHPSSYLTPYNFAFVACAFFKIGSNFVAFITSPFAFNLPPINSLCAFALPSISFPKSTSLRLSVTVGFSPTPLETVPVDFRSIFHESSSPALFLRVKAKTALPDLMASLRSASEEERASFIASNATEEGNAAGRLLTFLCFVAECGEKGEEILLTVCERHGEYRCGETDFMVSSSTLLIS